MTKQWKYQIRIFLSEDRAKVAREDPIGASLAPLNKILSKHQACLKCQYDAFSEYCALAEESGETNLPLYRWTKATLADPKKVKKFMQSFSCYVEGDEIYEKHKADALEIDLAPLVNNGLIESLKKHDSNPLNNPQPPSKFTM